MSDILVPETITASRPYREGLTAGELRFQHCSQCGNRWLPAREACPRCLSAATEWLVSQGRGKIVSWVIYHTAYHADFRDRLPYDVTLVELAEGPRLLTNIVNSDGGRLLRKETPVTCRIEQRNGVHLALFALMD